MAYTNSQLKHLLAPLHHDHRRLAMLARAVLRTWEWFMGPLLRMRAHSYIHRYRNAGTAYVRVHSTASSSAIPFSHRNHAAADRFHAWK